MSAEPRHKGTCDPSNPDSLVVELRERLHLETLISELSRRLLSTETAALDDAIRDALQSVAAVGGADRTFFVSLPEMRRDRTFFFEWCSDAVPPREGTPSGDDADRYRGFAARLLAGEIVSVPVVAELPDTVATERAAMLEAGIRSYVLVPSVSRGRLMGILCLHCVLRERCWSSHELSLLQLVADLFTSALRRKRSETALAESEARFRALAENSQDSICELSAAGVVLYASPAYAALMASAREELEGRNFFELAHASDRAQLRERFRSAQGDDDVSPIVFRVCNREGERLDIEGTVRGFSTVVGETHFVGVLRDVSQRERDRRALERQVEGEQQIADLSRFFLDLEPASTQEATGEKLFVAASLAGAERAWMFTIDPRGIEANRQYGWSRDGDLSWTARLRHDPHAFPWALPQLMRGQVLNVPTVGDLPDTAVEERRDLQERGARSFLGIPLLSGRRFVGMMGFELTSREQRWSKEVVTLVRLVGGIFVSALRREQSEVELERSQNQLLQSQKMEAVGTLAGGIAHDFNNHLAVMLGNARFVASTAPADAEVSGALADLQRSAEHCAQLTRSLLAFSRRSPVSIQVVEVARAMAAVADLVRPLLPSSIALEVAADEESDGVRADPTQLRQVLINLLVNARDAMPEGGRLRIESGRRRVSTQEAWSLGLPGAGRYVEIRVSDEGEGMSAETRSRIFEPFFTTKRLGEGTGLGLATAYGIIQQCHGAITVESELHRGTTFYLLLPLADEDEGHREPLAAADLVPGSETLLLVEDEPAVRRLLSRTLRRHGYRVLEAENGLAALAVAEAAGPELDLLVTDLAMPHLGGAELAAKLQAMRSDLRVLLLSGHAAPHDGSANTAIRGARFLQKPFDDESLLREVRFLLDLA